MSRAARTARLALSVALLGSCAAIAAGSAGAAAATRTMTLYSVAQQEQYVNNSDSLALGEKDNPFGNFKDVTPSASKSSRGPFPGDESVFSFNLYTSPSLTKRAGAATFTCQYNFGKNAFCDVIFELKSGGTLLAEGAFNFNASKIELAVTGGTGPYQDQTGVVAESPAANHSQKLAFQLF
jgi:hypothetical protein